MKKVITVSLLLVFVLAGCAGQSSDNQNETNKISGKSRMPDFERPEEMPGVSGIVKSIVGNEVIVLKIDRPERGGAEGMAEMSDEERAERRTTINPGAIIGGGGGGMHMGGMGRPGGTGEDSGSMIEAMKNFSTGEETVLIPVGIRMLKADTSSEEPSMIEANLTDIKVDTMVSIWLDESVTDRNIASFVLIR